ncbi:hypothetical protein AM501_24005 [Aneurinibacillus migulanus]|uniref:NYN domain-containing protein n=1 Tax=Aneurinibacillus migulanus TaxID=47500 RepID=UPI0005BCB4E7|nr:NYN domain-containing protein [Aneurinibacillus migulanus]KIV58927.1 hypothetical protein TS64_03975 [Aneurinibacillus migulanus]KPD05841.1 hypothetical protein AM501_24005 [Aneurinibacillus migulanus]
MKAAILIDEINAMAQFHALGIEGIRPWKHFYDALASILRAEYGEELSVNYRMYGAIPTIEMDSERHYTRKRFFNALQRDGIHVRQGYCYQNENGLVQKGVDMLMGLDLFELSQQQYQLLFVFSGDSDFIPAIHRAKERSKVIAILRDNQPANLIKEHVDAYVSLEDIISILSEEHIVHRSRRHKIA